MATVTNTEARPAPATSSHAPASKPLPFKVPARAFQWGFGKSPDKRTPYVQVSFELTAGDQKGRRLLWRGYLTEDAAARTIESLRLMGWRGSRLDDGLPGLHTNEVELVVEHEESQKEAGKFWPKVAFVNRLQGGLDVCLGDNDVTDLADAWVEFTSEAGS